MPLLTPRLLAGCHTLVREIASHEGVNAPTVKGRKKMKDEQVCVLTGLDRPQTLEIAVQKGAQ